MFFAYMFMTIQITLYIKKELNRAPININVLLYKKFKNFSDDKKIEKSLSIKEVVSCFSFSGAMFIRHSEFLMKIFLKYLLLEFLVLCVRCCQLYSF